MTCDGCQREGVFRSIWDVHVDLRTMEILCTRCFVERGGGDGECLTNREREALLLSVGPLPGCG